MKAFYRMTSFLCMFLVIFVLFPGIAAADFVTTNDVTTDVVTIGVDTIFDNSVEPIYVSDVPDNSYSVSGLHIKGIYPPNV